MNKYTTYFEKLTQEIEKNKLVHESLHKLYPIVIVTSNHMELYDIDHLSQYYLVRKDEKFDFIPDEILAVFPFEYNDGKMTAIVHEEALKQVLGRIFIQHEFVHCYQSEKCESKLIRQLDIYNKAMEENNNMWEMTHPFPYDSEDIQEHLKCLSDFDFNNPTSTNEILNEISVLRSKLNNHDFEYMIWQMWVEGFARYIENELRKSVGIEYNYHSYDGSFDRRVFYQIGDHYFRSMKDKAIDIELAFHTLLSIR